MNTGAKPQPKFAYIVLILGTLTAFGPLSIDMYLPAFPQIARDFQASIATVQHQKGEHPSGISLLEKIAHDRARDDHPTARPKRLKKPGKDKRLDIRS